MNDLEIYLLKADAPNVRHWLETALEQTCTQTEKGNTLLWQFKHMDVVFNPRVEKNISSLWFKTNHTPWSDDLACAHAAHNALNVEVRCAATQWQEAEDKADDAAQWIKIIRGQESPCHW